MLIGVSIAAKLRDWSSTTDSRKVIFVANSCIRIRLSKSEVFKFNPEKFRHQIN